MNMIAKNPTPNGRPEPWPKDRPEAANSDESQAGSAGSKKAHTIENPAAFFELSQFTGLLLEGIAGANLKNTGQLVFFKDEDALFAGESTEIPFRRIQCMEVISESPLRNTPLDLPSLWQVRISLHPTEGLRTEKLFTVFENE